MAKTQPDTLHRCLNLAPWSRPVTDCMRRSSSQVSQWIVDPAVRVIIMTGGTGFSDRDVTPEAITPLFDKEIPGFGEVFRSISHEEIGPSTLQSRALAGIANGTFISIALLSSGDELVMPGQALAAGQIYKRRPALHPRTPNLPARRHPRIFPLFRAVQLTFAGIGLARETLSLSNYPTTNPAAGRREMSLRTTDRHATASAFGAAYRKNKRPFYPSPAVVCRQRATLSPPRRFEFTFRFTSIAYQVSLYFLQFPPHPDHLPNHAPRLSVLYQTVGGAGEQTHRRGPTLWQRGGFAGVGFVLTGDQGSS